MNSSFRGNSVFLRRNLDSLCKDNLIFNPAYLTDTEWVSKTDSCPVLSVVSEDNTITGLGSNTIIAIDTDATYSLSEGVISFSTSGYISYLELSNGSKYNFTGKNANDLTENGLNLTITGTQTDLWGKKRVLLKGDDRTNLLNVEKVKGKLVESTAVQTINSTQYLDSNYVYSEDTILAINCRIDELNGFSAGTLLNESNFHFVIASNSWVFRYGNSDTTKANIFSTTDFYTIIIHKGKLFIETKVQLTLDNINNIIEIATPFIVASYTFNHNVGTTLNIINRKG